MHTGHPRVPHAPQDDGQLYDVAVDIQLLAAVFDNHDPAIAFPVGVVVEGKVYLHGAWIAPAYAHIGDLLRFGFRRIGLHL